MVSGGVMQFLLDIRHLSISEGTREEPTGVLFNANRLANEHVAGVIILAHTRV